MADQQMQMREARIRSLKESIALAKADDSEIDAHGSKLLEAQEAELALLENYKPEPPPPPELTTRIRMQSYLQAATFGTQLQGAEAELHQEMNLGQANLPGDLAGGTIVPIWALADTSIETRERAAVAVTTGDYSANVRGVLGQIFAGMDADFLGARIEVVPAGQARYPVISGITGPQARTKGQAATERDGTLTVHKLDALRLTSFITVNAVDNDMDWRSLETAMTNAQRASLREGLGDSIINGNDSSGQPEGILDGVASITAETTTTTFAQMKTKLVAGVDGKLATSEEGIRLLLGAATYRFARGLYRTNSSEQDAIAMLRSLGARVAVSDHIPAVASNTQNAIRVTDGQAIAIPIWSYYVLIRDPYTKSENNQVRLVSHAFHNVKVLRQDGVVGLSFKVS